MENSFNYETLQIENISYGFSNIFQIKLSREKALNSLSLTMLNELNDLFDKIKNNDEIRTVVITGSGNKAFCAGADINQLKILEQETGYSFAKSGQEVFNKIENLGKPVIAAINGYCFGGGLELAMACTIRIASNNTIFGQPEIKLGIIPGYGGTQRLSRLIGKGRALEYCLTGNNLNIENALNWGLITSITTAESLIDSAYKLADSLNKMPRHAMASVIETVNNGFDLKMKDALELEAVHFGNLCDTEDKRIGVEAFLNKLSPEFE